ncbi:hypothetical protein C2G38_2157814 [Gigaspora rosea]|uniref:Uncharacterized protein n=1 Tax=Gigaspora rosea TaxID=44941 RepID=A0A397W2Q2_9GLOM|nr:hypothetical protein C2G38_2157814 [Gigaspora rosea]
MYLLSKQIKQINNLLKTLMNEYSTSTNKAITKVLDKKIAIHEKTIKSNDFFSNNCRSSYNAFDLNSLGLPVKNSVVTSLKSNKKSLALALMSNWTYG